MKKKEVKEIKKVEIRSEKEKKKRIINLSIIIASIVVVVAGLITGLVFLLTSKSPERNPEMDKFTESVNNSNQTTTDIKSEGVILPTDTEIGDIKYIDAKYIVATTDGVESIYIRNESEGAPSKIVSFAKDSEQISYTKVEEIIDDFAIIYDKYSKCTNIVNLVDKNVVIDISNFQDYSIKNNYVLMIEFDDQNNYKSFFVYDLILNKIVLEMNQNDNISSIRIEENLICVRKNDYSSVLYKFETNNGELFKINDNGLNSIQNYIVQYGDYLLIENMVLTTEYKLANYHINNDYYIIDYYLLNKNSFVSNSIDFGGKVKSYEYINFNEYCGLELVNFNTYNEEGKITSNIPCDKFIIIDKTFKKILNYNKPLFGEIIYFDGEVFVTSGTKSNFMDLNGEEVEILDKQKYSVNSLNSWNGMFLVDGISGVGISNTNGDVVASNNFDKISPIIDGFAIGYYNGHYYKLDISNGTGTLLNNYAVNYSALSFMGCGVYVCENELLTMYSMNGNVLYDGIKSIQVLDIVDNNIQLILNISDEHILTNLRFLNSSIAQQFLYGDYQTLDIDNDLESYPVLNSLNISGLSSYKVEDKENLQPQTATIKEEFSSESNAYKFFTLDNTDFKITNYLDAEIYSLKYIVENERYLNYVYDLDSFKQLLPKVTDWNTNSSTFGKVDVNTVFNVKEDIKDCEGSGSTKYNGVTIQGGTYVKSIKVFDINCGIVSSALLEHIHIETSSEENGGCDDKYTVTTTKIKKYYSLYLAAYFVNGMTINGLSIVSNGSEIMNLYKKIGEELATFNLYDGLSDILITDSDYSSGVLVNNQKEGTWGAPVYFADRSPFGNTVIKPGQVRLPNGAVLVGMSFSLDNDFKVQREYTHEDSIAGQLIPTGGGSNLAYISYSQVANKVYMEKWVLYKTLTNKDDSRSSDDGPETNNWTTSTGTNATMGMKISFGVSPDSAQYTSLQRGSFLYDRNSKYMIGSDKTIDFDYYSIYLGKDVISPSDNPYFELKVTAAPGYYVKKVSFATCDTGGESTTNSKGNPNPIKTYELSEKNNTCTIKLYINTLGISQTWDNAWKGLGDLFTPKDLANYDVDMYIRDLCVTICPLVNSITYYKKVQNSERYGLSGNDAYLDNAYKLYYAAPLINNMQTILTFIAGSKLSDAYQSSYYGLDDIGEKIISAKGYANNLFRASSHYYSLVENNDDNNYYYYINAGDVNSESDDIPFSFKYINDREKLDAVSFYGDPANLGGKGKNAYTFFNSMFNDDDGGNYDAYLFVEPVNYNVRLYLGDLDSQANTVKASGDNGSNWVELVESDYISDKTTDGWEYITFNQYYGETLEHAIKRSYADKKASTSGTDSDFVNMLAECSSFPKFLTPLQYTESNMSAVGNVDNIKNTDYYCSVTDSYDCTYQLTNKNKKVVNIGDYYIIFNWEDRKFAINFESNHETYSLTGANVISSTDSNSTVKVETKNLSPVSIGEGSAARDIPWVYGYTGNNDVYDSVNKFKGWYLVSDKNPANEYRVFDSTVSRAVIPLSVNSHWLDSDFDGTIDLYAHYETVDDTKFLFDIKYFDKNNNEISTSNLGNYYNSSDFSIKGGTENLTIDDGVFYNKQNNTITIKIKPNSKTSLGSVGLDLYSCKNRKDADYSRFYTTQTLKWNNYTDKVYETYTGMKYQYDKASGVSYNNSDNKVKVTYSNGEYTIEIKTTIGSISSKVNGTKSMMYYGGAISLKFVDKLYDGNIEMTANSTEYNAINSNYIDLDFINNFKDYYSLPYLRKYNSV